MALGFPSGVNECQASKESPMRVQTDRIDRLTQELNNRLDELIGRLSPFIMMALDNRVADKCAPECSSSDYVMFMKQQCSRCEVAILKINNALSGLEI